MLTDWCYRMTIWSHIKDSLRDCCWELKKCQSRAHRETQTGSIITGDIWISSKLPKSVCCQMLRYQVVYVLFPYNTTGFVLTVCQALWQSGSYFAFLLMSTPSTLAPSYGDVFFLSTSDAPLPCGVCGGRFECVWERCLCVGDELAWDADFTFFFSFPVMMQLMQPCAAYGTTSFNCVDRVDCWFSFFCCCALLMCVMYLCVCVCSRRCFSSP